MENFEERKIYIGLKVSGNPSLSEKKADRPISFFMKEYKSDRLSSLLSLPPIPIPFLPERTLFITIEEKDRGKIQLWSSSNIPCIQIYEIGG